MSYFIATAAFLVYLGILVHAYVVSNKWKFKYEQECISSRLWHNEAKKYLKPTYNPKALALACHTFYHSVDFDVYDRFRSEIHRLENEYRNRPCVTHCPE